MIISNACEHLVEALQGVVVVILTVNGADGHPRSRPLVLQEVDQDGSLWFFVGRSSLLALDIRHHPQVAIATADHQAMAYVAVAGVAHPCEDRLRAIQLWKDEYLTWFPLGAADPDLLLLRVESLTVECWNGMAHHHFALPHRSARCWFSAADV